MAFDKSLAAEIDQSTVEGSEVSYPLIQWSYGSPKLAKHGGAEGAGGWFVSYDNIPGVMKDELIAAMIDSGWLEDSITLQNGASLDGLWKSEMTFSLINMRKRWRATDGARTFYYSWGWQQYEKAVKMHGRATSQLHLYVMVQELEQFSPFIVTLSASAAMAFEGTRKQAGALTQFQRTVIAAANAATKGARWPYRAFWLTVTTAQDSKGKPIFTEVGHGENTTHVVLPVAKNLPNDPKQVDLDAFALNKADFRRAQDLYTDSVAWKAAWDNIETDEQTAEASLDMSDDQVEAAMAEVGM
jgi:hypothetical protein